MANLAQYIAEPGIGSVYLRGYVNLMSTRFRLIRRGIRGNGFYCVDTSTGKRTSLRTDDENVATQLVEARNIAERQPSLNLQIAKAYLAGTDSGLSTRTWQDAFAGESSGGHAFSYIGVPKLPTAVRVSRVRFEPGEE